MDLSELRRSERLLLNKRVHTKVAAGSFAEEAEKVFASFMEDVEKDNKALPIFQSDATALQHEAEGRLKLPWHSVDDMRVPSMHTEASAQLYEKQPVLVVDGVEAVISPPMTPCWWNHDNLTAGPRVACVPNFYVLGVPKCGTTVLFRCIIKHPYVVNPYGKETHFWSGAIRRESEKSVYVRDFSLRTGEQYIKKIREEPAIHPNWARLAIGDFSPENFALVGDPIVRDEFFEPWKWRDRLKEGPNAEGRLAGWVSWGRKRRWQRRTPGGVVDRGGVWADGMGESVRAGSAGGSAGGTAIWPLADADRGNGVGVKGSAGNGTEARNGAANGSAKGAAKGAANRSAKGAGKGTSGGADDDRPVWPIFARHVRRKVPLAEYMRYRQPGARLVISLRSPPERTASHYFMLCNMRCKSALAAAENATQLESEWEAGFPDKQSGCMCPATGASFHRMMTMAVEYLRACIDTHGVALCALARGEYLWQSSNRQHGAPPGGQKPSANSGNANANGGANASSSASSAASSAGFFPFPVDTAGGNDPVRNSMRVAVTWLQDSLYAPAMQTWLATFPREQLLVLDYHDLVAAPTETLKRVFDHIGVGTEILSQTESWTRVLGHIRLGESDEQKPDAEHNLKASHGTTVLLPETAQLLRDFFAPHVRVLAELLGDDRFLRWTDRTPEATARLIEYIEGRSLAAPYAGYRFEPIPGELVDDPEKDTEEVKRRIEEQRRKVIRRGLINH